MKTELNEITINGTTYVVKGASRDAPAFNTEGLPYVVVRADRAGVFAGYLKSKDVVNKIVVLVSVRRLWCWYGAASCSDLARKGVTNTKDSKFTAPNSEIEIANYIEILAATDAARKSLEGVPVWQA